MRYQWSSMLVAICSLLLVRFATSLVTDREVQPLGSLYASAINYKNVTSLESSNLNSIIEQQANKVILDILNKISLDTASGSQSPIEISKSNEPHKIRLRWPNRPISFTRKEDKLRKNTIKKYNNTFDTVTVVSKSPGDNMLTSGKTTKLNTNHHRWNIPAVKTRLALKDKFGRSIGMKKTGSMRPNQNQSKVFATDYQGVYLVDVTPSFRPTAIAHKYDSGSLPQIKANRRISPLELKMVTSQKGHHYVEPKYTILDNKSSVTPTSLAASKIATTWKNPRLVSFVGKHTPGRVIHKKNARKNETIQSDVRAKSNAHRDSLVQSGSRSNISYKDTAKISHSHSTQDQNKHQKKTMISTQSPNLVTFDKFSKTNRNVTTDLTSIVNVINVQNQDVANSSSVTIDTTSEIGSRSLGDRLRSIPNNTLNSKIMYITRALLSRLVELKSRHPHNYMDILNRELVQSGVIENPINKSANNALNVGMPDGTFSLTNEMQSSAVSETKHLRDGVIFPTLTSSETTQNSITIPIVTESARGTDANSFGITGEIINAPSVKHKLTSNRLHGFLFNATANEEIVPNVTNFGPNSFLGKLFPELALSAEPSPVSGALATGGSIQTEVDTSTTSMPQAPPSVQPNVSVKEKTALLDFGGSIAEKMNVAGRKHFIQADSPKNPVDGKLRATKALHQQKLLQNEQEKQKQQWTQKHPQKQQPEQQKLLEPQIEQKQPKEHQQQLEQQQQRQQLQEQEQQQLLEQQQRQQRPSLTTHINNIKQSHVSQNTQTGNTGVGSHTQLDNRLHGTNMSTNFTIKEKLAETTLATSGDTTTIVIPEEYVPRVASPETTAKDAAGFPEVIPVEQSAVDCNLHHRADPYYMSVYWQKVDTRWARYTCIYPYIVWNQQFCRCQLAGFCADNAPVPGFPHLYSNNQKGQWTTLQCPPPTQWDQERCQCSLEGVGNHTAPSTTLETAHSLTSQDLGWQCDTLLDADFQRGPQEFSPYQQTILIRPENTAPVVTNGALEIAGGYVYIPGLTQLDLSQPFEVRLLFSSFNDSRVVTLMSNHCDPQVAPTLAVEYQASSNTYSLIVLPRDSPTARALECRDTSDKVKPTMLEVKMDTHISLTINNVGCIPPTEILGGLAISDCSLSFGGDEASVTTPMSGYFQRITVTQWCT